MVLAILYYLNLLGYTFRLTKDLPCFDIFKTLVEEGPEEVHVIF